MRPLHTEPLRSDHPLATMDNAALTAHAGFRTLEAHRFVDLVVAE
jgi:phosphoglycerate dehydrogenase-like enzyme